MNFKIDENNVNKLHVQLNSLDIYSIYIVKLFGMKEKLVFVVIYQFIDGPWKSLIMLKYPRVHLGSESLSFTNLVILGV